VSIGLGMLYFLGFMGWSGRELNALSALYPVLMIIVGTSDVIHIMSKYIDELRKGATRHAAIKVTIREIGMATLLTSLTTAIGFASLFTSRIYPIRDFGVNSAIGVLIAYITVLFLTTAILSMFKKEQIIKIGKSQLFWDKSMLWFYEFTKKHPRRIFSVFMVVLGLTFWGISMITTNYTIMQNMPTGAKITEDFKYFEEKFTGFRPMEIAVMAKKGNQADDFAVLKEIDKVEKYLKNYPQIRATNSITSVYKSINQMNKSNRPEAYELPKTEKKYKQYKRMAEKVPQLNSGILLSKDGTKARITSRMTDFGAENIKEVGRNMDQWFLENTDTSIVSFKRTGTGLIIDKNAEYIRVSLLQGLAMAILIVCVLMALLFQNWKMLIISLVPNVVPLLLAGALLGFIGIELEAGISVVFAIVFGIAVDDTIHFLSKFKLSQRKGLSVDEALKITFLETGKAICLTTIILFFGFLIMLFSVHPPSVSIGLLISVTLFSAVFADLLLIPILIRWLL
jgi:predicted RND superfamily exporter protein